MYANIDLYLLIIFIYIYIYKTPAKKPANIHEKI